MKSARLTPMPATPLDKRIAEVFRDQVYVASVDQDDCRGEPARWQLRNGVVEVAVAGSATFSRISSMRQARDVVDWFRRVADDAAEHL